MHKFLIVCRDECACLYAFTFFFFSFLKVKNASVFFTLFSLFLTVGHLYHILSYVMFTVLVINIYADMLHDCEKVFFILSPISTL